MQWDHKQKKLVPRPDQPIEGYPGWVERDCGCCNGLVWMHGDECTRCDGSGWYAKHLKSGFTARYPGGPTLGKEIPEAPYIEETVKINRYNPKYGDDRICECGHPYYRHFDTYEDMAPVGCKYCICYEFKLGEEQP